MKTFEVRIAEEAGFNPAQIAKMAQARDLWERTWNLDAFRTRVITFAYWSEVKTGIWPFRKKENRLIRGFRMTSLSPGQVFETIMSGAEKLSPEIDGEADISVTLDARDAGSVIGYTYPNTRMQWIYASFFGRATPADIAGNLAHEYCHKIGFEHEFNFTSLRQYTVPYAIGYLTREIANNLTKGEPS